MNVHVHAYDLHVYESSTSLYTQARLHQKLLSLQQQIQSLRTSQTQISKSKTLSISPSSATTAATSTVPSLPKYTPPVMTNAVCSSESHGRKEGTFPLVNEVHYKTKIAPYCAKILYI